MKKLRELRYRFFSWRWFKKIEPSEEEIDVVIPIVKKDLHILPLCLEGVRKCVCHPIRHIYIVAKSSEEVKEFCITNDAIFVDETSVFGFAPHALNIRVGNGEGFDRSGWLFQQLLKLSGRIGTCNNYLCIDADHVLIRPHVFMSRQNKTVFYMSYEEHLPYYRNIQRLLPGTKLASLSYVDHKMLFNKPLLSQLHKALEANTAIEGSTWYEKIINSYDRMEFAGFSEFETYGNFVQDKILRPWLQKRLPYKRLANYETLRKKYQRRRWSLTFPNYMKENKQTTHQTKEIS